MLPNEVTDLPAADIRSCQVVRVMSHLNFGGTELRTAELIPRLAAAGTTVHIVTLSDKVGRGPLVGVARQHGGTITPIPLNAGFPIRFLRLLRRLRPDAVHVDCANFSGLVLSVAAICGIPVRVAHFRGDDIQRRTLRRRVQRWLFGRMLKVSATDILGVSDGSLTFGFDRNWRGDRRCQIVLNGLEVDRLLKPGHDDLRSLAGAGPDDLLCINVGRGAPDKRRWLLPPILAALRTAGVDAHIFLIGPDEHDDDRRVRAAAVEHGVSDRVHFLGARDDVGWLLRQADVVIHPSRVEGLPGGVLEPVALGIGTVAANLPGVCYIDQHLSGVTIVDTDAEPEVWAAAALTAAKHTATTVGADAVHNFSQSVFAIDEAVNTHLAIYRRRAYGQPPDYLSAGAPRPLIVGAYAFPHGDATSNRLLQLARCATPEGGRAVVVNDLLVDNSELVGEYDVPGIQLIALRTSGRNRLARLIARLTRPMRVLRALHRRGIGRRDISTIILPMAMMNLGTWAILRIALRRPVVVDATEKHDRHQFKHGWLAPYFVRHRWSLFLATRLVRRATSVSTTLGEYLSQRNMKVMVVPPQVDCTEFEDSRPPSIVDGVRLLYAGTPGRKDMLNVIVRGISLLSPSGQKRIRLVIAGVARQDAARMSDLDVAVLDELVADVEFLGRVPRSVVTSLLSESHFSMLVRPEGGYASFGFPSKIPESLAAGCPVIVNYTSDLAMYLQDRAEAIILGGASADDVRRGLERALALRDEEWAAMSAAARTRASTSFDYRPWRQEVSSFVSQH